MHALLLRRGRRGLHAAAFALLSVTAIAFGVDRASLDPKTPAGDDFWTYANGAWIKAHPIPADRSSYGRAAVLTEETGKRTVAPLR